MKPTSVSATFKGKTAHVEADYTHDRRQEIRLAGAGLLGVAEARTLSKLLIAAADWLEAQVDETSNLLEQGDDARSGRF